MLDKALLRNNPELVKNDLRKRGALEKIAWVDEFLKLDREGRQIKHRIDELRHQRNVMARKIGELKKGGLDVEKEVKQMQKIRMEIQSLERKLDEINSRIEYILYRLPNILHESVPVGEDENDNVVVRTWGEPTKFTFTPKSHVDIMVDLDLVDLERAAKVSGARFYYLKNELALLALALMRFGVDFLLKKGFTLVEPPFMMRERPYMGATALSDFEDMLYKVEGEDLYLIATSEHPLAAMHMDEILDGKLLPLKYAGISPCFRKEAGTHGKDTKGIFRVHQFDKVEQFVFSRPEESWDIHEELIANAEEVYQMLKLPYRIVNICTGDIGTVAAKKYDLEVWMPSQGRYREVVSCSNCTDYQARRLNIRFRDRTDEKPKFVHTLNSTLIAAQRTIVAILENYQREDGTVRVPDVLVPYMNGMKVIGESR